MKFNALYLSKPVLLVFLLGFASGLPLSYTAGTLSAILFDRGVSLTAIGISTVIGLPYVLRFMWSPIFDIFELKFIQGLRKGWIVFFQVILLFALNAMGYAAEYSNIETVVAVALVIAIISSSHDVVIDAFRIEKLKQAEQAAGVAATQFGYRLALILTGGFGLILAQHHGWQNSIFFISLSYIPTIILTILSTEKEISRIRPNGLQKNFEQCVIKPFREFIERKDSWYYIMLFILLYKMSDAFASALTTPFYLSIGFTKAEVGTVVKLYGVIATILGSFFGALMINKIGLKKVLFWGIVVQSFSNFVYILQYEVGNSVPLLMFTVSVENFSGGIGSTALIMYMSTICNKEFTATQYALLASLAGFTRTIVGSASGYVVDNFDWTPYFILSIGLSLPALLIVKYCRIGIDSNK